nr:hypothetical protein BaRGS_033653 [Batillaria attramentaria]
MSGPFLQQEWHAIPQQMLQNLVHSMRQRVDFGEDAESDEEEGDIGDRVLQDVFKSYSNNYEDAEHEDGDVSKAQEHLLHSFRSGTSACLICIDNIKREDADYAMSY